MKKWAFLLCCVLSLGFILVGCGNNEIKLSAKYDIIYNGPSATLVGDYLYFGNGMGSDPSISSLEGNYDSAKSLAYLARLNVNAEKFSTDGKDYTPKGVSNIGSEVVAYTGSASINSFEFSIGNYIFYATPNTWETTSGGYHYEYTTFYRSKLNGSDKKEIYSTRDINSSISKIEVVKYNGKFYILMLAGTKLVKLNLANNSTQVIEDVTSVAMPKTVRQEKLGSTSDWNGIIYYTKNDENSDENHIYKVSISDMTSQKAEEVRSISGTGPVTFIDREIAQIGDDNQLIDETFYIRDDKTYVLTVEKFLKDDKEEEMEVGRLFLDTALTVGTTVQRVITTISGSDYTRLKSLGYVYSSGNELNYVDEKTHKSNTIKFVNDSDSVSFDNVVVIDGEMIVLASTSNIYTAKLTGVFAGNSELQVNTVVSKSDIFTGSPLFAYDGDYVYYYAKLNAINTDQEDQSETGNDDTNYYFCRSSLKTSFFGEDNYQLLAKTKNGYRNSK